MTAQPRAALPMYDRPETIGAQQRLWSAIRAHAGGDDLPDALGTPDSLWDHWTAPDLVFTQTCGLPYRARLHDRVQLIGTADYGLPGCPPGHYNSVFVMRAEAADTDHATWAGLRLAYNSRNSQSGWAAPQNHMAALGLRFTRVTSTGAHLASLAAVASGTADIACVDAQTLRMARRWDDVADDLAEVGRTDPTPGLPFVTGPTGDRDRLDAAAAAAIAEMPEADRDVLGIVGYVAVPAEAYLAVPTPPGP